jgi:hypothetical protein
MLGARAASQPAFTSIMAPLFGLRRQSARHRRSRHHHPPRDAEAKVEYAEVPDLPCHHIARGGHSGFSNGTHIGIFDGFLIEHFVASITQVQIISGRASAPHNRREPSLDIHVRPARAVSPGRDAAGNESMMWVKIW